MNEKGKLRIPTMKTGGIASLFLGIVLFALLPSQVKITGQSGITSRTIPMLLGGILILCGATLFIKGAIQKREDYKEINLGDELRKLVFMVMLVVYVFAISYIGFMTASLIFSMVLLAFIGERKKARFAVVAVSVAVIYVTFHYLLKVDFGSLWGI